MPVNSYIKWVQIIYFFIQIHISFTYKKKSMLTDFDYITLDYDEEHEDPET